MRRAVYYTNIGEITQYLESTDNALPEIPGVLHLEVDSRADYAAFYVDVVAGLLASKGVQPSACHKFNYITKQWEPGHALAESQAKTTRAKLLSASDWTQLPDVPLATKEAWAIYRQDLRDITEQPGYPLEVVWPVAPS